MLKRSVGSSKNVESLGLLILVWLFSEYIWVLLCAMYWIYNDVWSKELAAVGDCTLDIIKCDKSEINRMLRK